MAGTMTSLPVWVQSWWRPIETAPTDGTLILVFAPGGEFDLPDLQSVCAYHQDGGFCIDEMRHPTHWMPLPPPPAKR